MCFSLDKASLQVQTKCKWPDVLIIYYNSIGYFKDNIKLNFNNKKCAVIKSSSCIVFILCVCFYIFFCPFFILFNAIWDKISSSSKSTMWNMYQLVYVTNVIFSFYSVSYFLRLAKQWQILFLCIVFFAMWVMNNIIMKIMGNTVYHAFILLFLIFIFAINFSGEAENADV